MATVLITGATDGIGNALARSYSRAGHPPIRVGRRPAEEIAGATSLDLDLYCRVDLADPGAADAVLAFLAAKQIDGLDRLIHCAALGFIGPVEEQSNSDIRSLLDVNLRAPLLLTRDLLPHLVRRRGKIVFISSVVSSLACPEYAVYAASKAALDGFARSLRIELASGRSGDRGRVAVQVVHPGATRTDLHRKAGAPEELLARAQRFPGADEVAKKIARAIEGSSRAVTIGMGNRIAGAAGSVLSAPLDGWQRRRAARS